MATSLMLPAASVPRPCTTSSSYASSRRLALFQLVTTGGIGNLYTFLLHFTRKAFIALVITLFPATSFGYSALPQSQLFGAKGSELLRVAEATAAENLAQPEKNLFDWVKNDNRRFLHVVYRVGDLEKTIKYAILEFRK